MLLNRSLQSLYKNIIKLSLFTDPTIISYRLIFSHFCSKSYAFAVFPLKSLVWYVRLTVSFTSFALNIFSVTLWTSLIVNLFWFDHIFMPKVIIISNNITHLNNINIFWHRRHIFMNLTLQGSTKSLLRTHLTTFKREHISVFLSFKNIPSCINQSSWYWSTHTSISFWLQSRIFGAWYRIPIRKTKVWYPFLCGFWLLLLNLRFL